MSLVRVVASVFALLCLIASPPKRAHAATCGSWTNPAVPPENRDGPDVEKHPDLGLVPEGLTMVGPKVDAPGETLAIDCGKPTLIFVHGWMPWGEATYLAEAPRWQQDFNVFIFRWHRLAYAPKAVFPAEARVPEAFARLESETASLLKRLGGREYRHEIRVVAQSLGSQLALPLVRGVLNQGLTHPRRLELLDPFLWVDMRSVDSTWSPRPLLVPHEHYDALRMARAMGVKTVVYASAVQRFLGRTMHEVANVQAMRREWMEGDDARSHIVLANWYFQSLDAPPPPLLDPTGASIGKAFSASLPTSEFPLGRVRYVQTSNGMSSDWAGDHSFVRESP
jgi:hypothetical protein